MNSLLYGSGTMGGGGSIIGGGITGGGMANGGGKAMFGNPGGGREKSMATGGFSTGGVSVCYLDEEQ